MLRNATRVAILFLLIVIESDSVLGFQASTDNANEVRVVDRPMLQEPLEQDPHVQAVHGKFDDLADHLLVLDPEVGEAALKHLEDLGRLHRENRLKVKTWKGVAESSYWTRNRGDAMQQIRYMFEIDQSQEAHKVTSQTLMLHEGREPEVVFMMFVMRLGGDIYSMGPWSPTNKAIVTDLEISHGKLRSGHDSGHFSPLTYFTQHDWAIEDMFAAKIQAYRAGHSEIKVRRNDEYARIDERSLKGPVYAVYYVLDLKRGTTICRHFANNAVETVWRHVTLEEIDGVWLPKRDHQCVLYKKESSRDQDRSHVVQFLSELNQPLADNAIQLAGLELGDEFDVRDRRSDSRYRYRKNGGSQDTRERGESENGAKNSDGSGRTPMTTNSFRPAMAHPPNLIENSWSYRELIVIVGMGITTFGVFHCIGTILCTTRNRSVVLNECEFSDG